MSVRLDILYRSRTCLSSIAPAHEGVRPIAGDIGLFYAAAIGRHIQKVVAKIIFIKPNQLFSQ